MNRRKWDSGGGDFGKPMHELRLPHVPPTWLPQPKLARVLGQWFSWGASLLTYLLRKNSRDRESGAGYLTKELPRVLSPSEMPGSRHGYLIGIGKVGHL